MIRLLHTAAVVAAVGMAYAEVAYQALAAVQLRLVGTVNKCIIG